MKKRLSLYHKYTIIIICVGLLPMTIIATLAVQRMVQEHHEVITNNYKQATQYMSIELGDMLDSYDEITKLLYFYNADADRQSNYTYGNYLNLKNILMEDPEIKEEKVRRLLSLMQSMDSDIDSVHFVENKQGNTKKGYHYSTKYTYFDNEAVFNEYTGLTAKQQKSKKLILLPPHLNEYYHNEEENVITIARNYFDLSNTKISNESLIGTLYIDINTQSLSKVYREYFTDDIHAVYVFDEQNTCYYSTNQQWIGKSIQKLIDTDSGNMNYIFLRTEEPQYQLFTAVMLESSKLFERLRQLQKIIYIIMALSVITLAVSSIFFSKRLSRPLTDMMGKMSEIQTGNFKVRLPVNSNDEVGQLAKRFNEMSNQLEIYVNQVYVSKVRQTEAELTSLRSQIYPHFLYNTLEVIRMTALEAEDEKVSEMIEALSAQIHYIIGNVKDMVPLREEASIVEKYVYLLNFRITQTIKLSVNIPETSDVMIPKLLLQPIVENAYLHGLKPKKGNGNIRIEAAIKGENINIYVMDDGVGMPRQTLDRLKKLLEGSGNGICNKNNRQSIGIKNVNDRIRYIYGEQYGMDITSSQGVGTIINISIPSTNEEENVYDTDGNSR